MLQVGGEVDPAHVGLQLRVAGMLEEVAAGRVEGRHAGIAAARQVDGRQIERQAEQVVAQRLGDELVDLVAGLAGHAAHDGAGGFGGRQRAVVIERQRIEEGLDQADVARDEVGIEAVDGLGQHRVAEAIDDVRELGDDRRIDGGVVLQESVDVRLDLARELLEHEVLVLHLGGELGGLEQALAVPHAGRELPLCDERGIAAGEHSRLDLVDLPVVLGVEDVVDGGQGDVLVAAAVAGDEVRIEQFVVIGRRRRRRRWCRGRCRPLARPRVLAPGPSGSNMPGAA